ncbi:TIGR03087 family PEP-CTERM/XrtA system glycosyltransferase [Methylococcus sp. EFPC2]|nr:TIGR03087 family PEP-CTERM/XrtA system glycosyltransferase [Methylococcus sp. EFPC2]
MKDLLFLAHRIPFPPNKGDKIRSFNLLRHLSAKWRIHLGAFVDDPDDYRYLDVLQAYCKSICLVPLSPLRGRLRSLKGLLSGQALTVPYYSDKAMRVWVEKTAAECSLDGVLVFSSAMAQYAEGLGHLPRVIDFVDVDSDKWRQYADGKPWPANWVYRREAERLLEYDRGVAARFDRSVFVSEAEAALFRRLAPESAAKTVAVENGVDTGYFDPDRDYPNPYTAGAEVLVFTGAMDYWANIDAVSWFARAVFAKLREIKPQVEFFIVGSRPAQAVRDLAAIPGIKVTGAVEDVRPYLSHARLAVAPLRIARGIQNKVLEAMAMGKSLLASPQAMEGIEGAEGLDLRVLDDAGTWVSALLAAKDSVHPLPVRSAPNRAFVVDRYGWPRSLERLDACWREDSVEKL